MMLVEYPIEDGKYAVETSKASHVLGIDEVGLGACAGPLVVGGVVVPLGWSGKGVKDSKAFSTSLSDSAHAKRSKVFYEVIRNSAVYYYTAWYSAEDVDAVGIDTALQDLTRTVYVRCVSSTAGRVGKLLTVLDGKANNCAHSSYYTNALCFPKADKHIQAVSAASIVAKVSRDHYMMELGSSTPGYGFEQHKGYPTVQHKKAVQKYGLCDEHRRSYGKFIAAATGRRYN